MENVMRPSPINVSPKTALLFFLLFTSSLAVGQRPKWIATWTASPEAADPDPNEPLTNLNDQTVRERLRVTVGGRQIRIRLSNECSSAPLLVGRVSAGVAQGPANVVANSLRSVTFGGQDSILIPPGASMLSDPVDFPLKNGSEISISLYFPKHPSSVTWHALALKRAIISHRGDHTRDITILGGKESDSSVFLSAVLVPAQANSHVIVAFGDSIVDGDGSTPEAGRNWPSDLFRRLERTHNGSQFTVVNEGLAGNRLLSDGPVASLGISALARFDRDGLSVPGVTDIVLLEGTNDIGFPGATLGDLSLAPATDAPTVEDIIGAYRQLISRAHAHGIRVIGSTITPSEGVTVPGYHTEAKERMRQAVNQWIRTSRAFDAVIDFDAAVRDPNHPSRLLPRLASEDHLHPNDAGYQAMTDAIDLSLFP
jgi:lysophospholipase L1-like esterase